MEKWSQDPMALVGNQSDQPNDSALLLTFIVKIFQITCLIECKKPNKIIFNLWSTVMLQEKATMPCQPKDYQSTGFTPL